MSKINKYYLVKIDVDITKKPRLYQSDDELKYGDEVITYNKLGDKLGDNKAIGHVVGTIECSGATMAKLSYQVGGYFPLAKCEKPKEKAKDIFVLMGICDKNDSPITLLEKAIECLNEKKNESK